ncbi:cell division protein FtsL [Marinobacter caseinilyticus]|uniref:cell division protein FtsL n=1 Tax=Marinobacter caseinilyticus TaxID=2692195 RepID=UPI001409E5AB|nr:cell division protein FtsL [Marinobacter caseinilyticus]
MSAVTIERPAKTATFNKQAVRESVSSTIGLSKQIFQTLCQKNMLVSFALVLVLIVSAIGVVISAHENRQLFNALSELHAERDGYQREWSQLLLEQSALSAHGRIERSAAEKLVMTVPGKESIVLVPVAMPYILAHEQVQQ